MNQMNLVNADMSTAPSSFQVLPEGYIEISGDTPAHLTETAALKIIARFKARGNDMVIDYEHQTLKDAQAPAAGWVKELLWKGKSGLWAVVEWTKKARAYLENREYRYFSPVVFVSASDRLISTLESVALTNTPAINNLKPLVAKMNFSEAQNMPLDERQRHINRLLSVGDDVFLKYSRGLHTDDPAKQKQAQSVIDEFHKAGDQVFAKYQNQPEKWPGIIDECQRRVNELMGINDETFLMVNKNRSEPDPSIDETQRKVNQLMGINDATFRKYNK